MKIKFVLIIHALVLSNFYLYSQTNALQVYANFKLSLNVNSITNGLNTGSGLIRNSFADDEINLTSVLDYSVGLIYNINKTGFLVGFSKYDLKQKMYSPFKIVKSTLTSIDRFDAINFQIIRSIYNNSKIKIDGRFGITSLFGPFNSKKFFVTSYPDSRLPSYDYVRNFQTLSGVNFLLHNSLVCNYFINKNISLDFGFDSFWGYRNLIVEMTNFYVTDNGVANTQGNSLSINKGDKINFNLGFKYNLH
jgi:hypothetical protein